MISVEGAGTSGYFRPERWDVRGGWEKESWAYRLDLFGPSGNITRLVPEAAVVHCMYSYDAARPWLGLSPLEWAKATGTLAANLEARLGQEAGGPVGYLLPVPLDSSPGTDDAPGPLDLLRKDVENLRGQSVLIETTSGGWQSRARCCTSWRLDSATNRGAHSGSKSSVTLRRGAGRPGRVRVSTWFV